MKGIQTDSPAAEPRLLSTPRAFISYRWESEEHISWVADFASRLARRRVHVVFDRFLAPPSPGRQRHPSEVAQRMQGCHIFIPIFTPGYLQRIGSGGRTRTEDGWVFDEWQLSLGLAAAKLIETVAVLRAGGFADLPPGFDSSNTVDLRTTEDDARKLNDLAYYMRFDRMVTAEGADVGPALDRFFGP